MSSSTASKLDALVGLRSAKRLLMRLAAEDPGVHAVLFYGVPGSGKHSLARTLAEAWLCKEPGPDGADGTCKACQAFERGNSPDFLRVAPQGPSRLIISGLISPSPTAKEDDPIAVTVYLRTTPLYSRHKVVLIEDAHRMNSGASNALLKTLEEPHPHAKLILTTDSVGGVLPTILSRCLAVACELPNDGELQQMAPNVSADVIRMSEGAPGRLSRAAERPELYERLAAFARSLKHRPAGGALVAADEFRELADVLGDESKMSARASNTNAIELLATFLAREPDAPPVWAQHAVEAHRLIQGNANAGIVLDAMFAKMLQEHR